MSRHPTWVELLAQPTSPEVLSHIQGCPQCRVDRRRLLVETPPDPTLPLPTRRRFEAAHERIARELLPSVRTMSATLPRHGRRGRLPPSGTAFGPYRAVGVLGRGETSLVLLGVHERHGTRHALKIVRTRDPALLEQVRREHAVQDELHHPLLLPVVDSVDAPTGQAVLVLEFVDGPSLAKLLRSRSALPWPWIDAIAIDVLLGVEALHEAGWVHRDLNPGNVLIDPNPRFRARVGDFGRALLRGAATDGPTAMPLYTAPEQLETRRVADARSDVFALGSLLYELVTHQRCFAGLDAEDVARRVREVEHIPVAQLRPDTPSRIAEAIEAALTVDLEARPARAAELLDLWTRGAGAGARPLVELSGADRAALRSMRGIEQLPEARSTLTPTSVPEPTGSLPALSRVQIEEQAFPRPKLPRVLRHGRWAALVGGVSLVVIVAFATNTSLRPVTAPPPTETRLDRGLNGIIDPNLAGNHRTLVFSDGRDLWLGPLDGSTPWALTGAFPGAATEPAWSFDNSSIAFTGPDGIYTVDLRRSDDPLPVVPWARDPTWSPDGSRIVFVAKPRDDQPVALRVWDRWTQEVVTLIEEPGLANPTFAPDGRRIALESGRGLELLDVRVDPEGRLELVDRQPLAPGDTAPQWLSATSLAVYRGQSSGPGGQLVRWDEFGSEWRDRVMLDTPHEVRTVQVGPDERWFVLGLTDPVARILRIDRTSGAVATPTFRAREPRIAPDGTLAYRLSESTIVRLDATGDPAATFDSPKPVDHWGFGPGGKLVLRQVIGVPPARDWVEALDDPPVEARPEPSDDANGALATATQNGRNDVEPRPVPPPRRPSAKVVASALLSGLPLEGPFATSDDGRFFAAQLEEAGSPVVVDLAEPVEPQLQAAREAPWVGDTVAGLSPDGSWLLVTEDDAFAVVDRLTGTSVGDELRGRGATFVDDDTIALVRADEVVLVDRASRVVQERYPLHPFSAPERATVAASSTAVWVDGIVEQGGLLRVDRLTGPARP